MITKNTTVYKCEFCKKKLFVKHAMEHHEKWCSRNPENFKACSGCAHLKEIRIEYWSKSFETTVTATGFRCSKLNKTMYPTRAQRKRLPEKYPETFKDQVPMPKECEHREQVYLNF